MIIGGNTREVLVCQGPGALFCGEDRAGQSSAAAAGPPAGAAASRTRSVLARTIRIRGQFLKQHSCFYEPLCLSVCPQIAFWPLEPLPIHFF